MENLKIKVSKEAESKEAQELFFELGFTWNGNKDIQELSFPIGGKYWLCAKNESGLFNLIKWGTGHDKGVLITIPELRDLVVLKRNSVEDATHRDSNNYDWYVANDEKHYRMQGDIWVYQPYIEGLDLKTIEKEVKMKEYLDANYELRSVKQTSGDNHVPKSWIEVPDGAEIFLLDKSWGEDTLYFVKHDGDVFHEYYINVTDLQNNTWIKGTIKGLHKGMGKVLWQRSRTTTSNTSIQEKLKFIEKWLNGEKIQYILGVESDTIQSEKTQWHNFTEGAMQYIKRSDIKFREAPKYVTINGIEFKSVESLLKHVKNNFDLEDGE